MTQITRKAIVAAALAGAALSASAQVGFYNIPVAAGADNFIAFQLDNSPNNDLDDVLTASSGVVTGSTFSEWDPASKTFNVTSTFNGTTWSSDLAFTPNGIGAEFVSPSAATITVVGSVVNFVGGQYTFVPPQRAPGTYLLALAAPLPNATFQQIVGTDPIDGDSVQTANGAVTTFNNGVWNNGTPSLGVGQAGLFTLAVPEPSTYALAVLGMTIVACFRLYSRKN